MAEHLIKSWETQDGTDRLELWRLQDETQPMRRVGGLYTDAGPADRWEYRRFDAGRQDGSCIPQSDRRLVERMIGDEIERGLQFGRRYTIERTYAGGAALTGRMLRVPGRHWSTK